MLLHSCDDDDAIMLWPVTKLRETYFAVF